MKPLGEQAEMMPREGANPTLPLHASAAAASNDIIAIGG